MAAWAGLGKVAWELAKKYWPLALAAWKQIDTFIQAHPGVSKPVRERLEHWRGVFVEAQANRSPEARVRATLDGVRRLGAEQAADEGSLDLDASTDWLARADKIERALALAETRAGRERKQMIAQVVKRTDALAAEAFLSLLPEEDPTDDLASIEAPAKQEH